jgi:hypothetical protein
MLKRILPILMLMLCCAVSAGAQNVPSTMSGGQVGQAVIHGGGGSYVYNQSFEAPIVGGNGTFGSLAVTTVLASYTATNKGHFIQLQSVNATGGACTTAPTVNVFDGTSNTGTAVTCSTSAQTKGVATTQTETQTFAAGDVIGIYISTAGGTCSAPTFTISAEVAEP